MKRDAAIWVLVALALLIVGVAVGRWATTGRSAAQPIEPGAGTEVRQWFWERRTLDLMTQVGLIFAGALGVAAILPGQDEGALAGPPHQDGGRP